MVDRANFKYGVLNQEETHQHSKFHYFREPIHIIQEHLEPSVENLKNA